MLVPSLMGKPRSRSRVTEPPSMTLDPAADPVRVAKEPHSRAVEPLPTVILVAPVLPWTTDISPSGTVKRSESVYWAVV